MSGENLEPFAMDIMRMPNGSFLLINSETAKIFTPAQLENLGFELISLGNRCIEIATKPQEETK